MRDVFQVLSDYWCVTAWASLMWLLTLALIIAAIESLPSRIASGRKRKREEETGR